MEKKTIQRKHTPRYTSQPTPLKAIVCRNVYKTRMMTLLYKLEIYIYISCFESRNRGSFQTIESNWIPAPSFATRRINFSFFLFHRKMFRLVPDWQMRGGERNTERFPSRARGKSIIEAFFFFLDRLMDLAYREECFS